MSPADPERLGASVFPCCCGGGHIHDVLNYMHIQDVLFRLNSAQGKNNCRLLSRSDAKKLLCKARKQETHAANQRMTPGGVAHTYHEEVVKTIATATTQDLGKHKCRSLYNPIGVPLTAAWEIFASLQSRDWYRWFRVSPAQVNPALTPSSCGKGSTIQPRTPCKTLYLANARSMLRSCLSGLNSECGRSGNTDGPN
ncbi:unnamed protein product [Ectocarpus fasciculatus]